MTGQRQPDEQVFQPSTGPSQLFFSIFFLHAERRVEAAEPHQTLETSRERIEEAEPGQLIHITYTTWVRPPPAGLEPEEPYHFDCAAGG